ncbi:MAG: extracellular solute-binding protein [Lachnospiraceae bacterium]
MKFKKIPAVALAVVTAAGLVACGGSSSGAEDAVGIRVWGAEDDQALLSELIAGFEAQYPDVDFDIQLGVESESTAKDTILTDVEAAADVFAFASDQIYDLVNAGALADLQNYEEAFERYPGRTLDEIKAANSESSVAAATVNDTFYAFPMAGDNSYFLYYDSSVISEEDARSWDTILEAAQTAGKKAGMVFSSGWYNAAFFYGAGFMTDLNPDGTTAMDWNGTSPEGYTGVQVVQSMLDIAGHPAFMSIADGDTANQIASGNLCAIVSGSWDAQAAQVAFGDGYAAARLPDFTIDGTSVPMKSAFGYKFIGVNEYSENIGWAVLLAEYLTNEESQIRRFEARQIGPTNLRAVATDEVQANYAIAAVIAQSEYSVIQKAGGKYWDPVQSFGEIIAQGALDRNDPAAIQTSLDALVEGVTAAIE